MRRALLLSAVGLCALASGTGDATAGTLAFSSNRCADEADNDARSAPFIMERGVCRGAIWLIEEDGSGLRRITDPGFSASINGDGFPSWSPDGRRLVFGREGDGIYITDADGQNAQRVAVQASLTGAEQPTWSPDGQRIAFVARPSDASNPVQSEPLDVYTMNPDGSGVTRLTQTPANSEYTPSFSPDGRRIVFTRDINQRDVPGDASKQGIFNVTTDGSVETRLTESTAFPFPGARFSPDGRYLALPLDGSLFTVETDGGNLVQRVPSYQELSTVAWADGGSTIIFPQRAGARDSQLVKLDLTRDGATAVPITSPGRSDRSPDLRGSRLPLPSVPPDTLAPAVRLFDTVTDRAIPTGPGGGRGASAAQVGAVRKKDLGYLAVDATGIGKLQVAVARRTGKRCRYLGSRGFSKKRRCGRPLFRALGGTTGWKRRVRRLRPATYTFSFRTRDRRGNSERRSAQSRVRLMR